jgi:hypothetical protein
MYSHSNIGVVETNGIDITPRVGYAALSSQIAIIKPTPVKMEDYSPSNSASPCQDITLRGGLDSYSGDLRGEIKISTALPEKPSHRVCSCMMENINCITNPMATMEDTSNWRKTLCSDDEPMCFGSTFNSTEGRYGSFLTCNLTENASWVQQQNYHDALRIRDVIHRSQMAPVHPHRNACAQQTSQGSRSFALAVRKRTKRLAEGLVPR